MIFAFECYADQDVFLFLRDDCKLPLRKSHVFGQGEVVNELLEKQGADLGMVDEDPMRPHHRLRDQMEVLVSTSYVELRKRQHRHLIVIKPDLEACFRRCMDQLNLGSQLPTRPEELRRVLGIPSQRVHQVFRQELKMLYQESKKRSAKTFVVELDEIVRELR